VTTLYLGSRVGLECVVTADGDPLPLRLDLARHSPTGFEWGYGGSGPAQLALALLAHHLGAAAALELYQRFKWSVVAKLNRDQWALTPSDIDEWLRRAAEVKE
jgi:Family of unknown function (DUF6166)